MVKQDKKDQTLYVVGGSQRTGTSMMMDALMQGGMKDQACYDKGREEMRKEHSDEHYDPNEGGLYELSREEYQKRKFPRGYEGKLIKCLRRGVVDMQPMYEGIRLVFMRRPFDQIKRSWRAFFDRELPFEDNATEHDVNMTEIIERCQFRKDFLSVDVFRYPKLVDDPLRYYKILESHGWPINPYESAKVVDPDLYRHREQA
jgi:hypothetical protein